MKRLALALLTLLLPLGLLGSPTHAQQPNGYLNPPVFGTGLIPETKSGTVTTTVLNSRNPPTNLYIYNINTISNWTILLPNPAFDGQLITVSCQSAVGILSVQSTDGSTVSSGVPTTCSFNSNFTIQWSATYNTWYMAVGPVVNGGGGGGSSLTVTDGTNVVPGTTIETFAGGATVSGTTPNAHVTIPSGITVTDNSNTVTGTTSLTFLGGTISGSTPDAEFVVGQQPISIGVTHVTGGTNNYVLTDNGGFLGNVPLPTPGITFTDGTNTVAGTTQLTITGGTIGGTSPNGTLTITPASAALTVGSTVINSGTSGFALTDNAGVLGNVAIPAAGFTLTDGTNTVTATTHLAITGGTVGGTTPNGTLTITPSNNLTVGTTTITGGTSGNALTISSGVLGNATIPTLTYAANSDIWAHSSTTEIINPSVAATSIAPQTFNETTGMFSINFASGINLELPLNHTDCPCTIANPTNVYAGLSGNLTLIQSSSGFDTIGTWGSTWKFSAGVKPTLSTTASAIDILPFYCRTTTFCVVTFIANAQ